MPVVVAMAVRVAVIMIMIMSAARTMLVIMIMRMACGFTLEISQFLMQDIVGQLQRDLIEHRERAHWHACLDSDVFDHGGGYAFA